MDWHDIAFSFWVRYNIIYVYIYINICTYKRKMWQSYFIIMFGYVYIYMMIWLLINFCCNWILCFCSVNSCPDSAINYLQTGDFSSLPLLCHYPVKVWYIWFFFFFYLVCEIIHEYLIKSYTCTHRLVVSMYILLWRHAFWMSNQILYVGYIRTACEFLVVYNICKYIYNKARST